jgi:hypothetical protein
MTAYTSSLIKVENPEVLKDIVVPYPTGECRISHAPEGTYEAPKNLVMEVKEAEECGHPCDDYNDVCQYHGCGFKNRKSALCSFLPDKEEEKQKLTESEVDIATWVKEKYQSIGKSVCEGLQHEQILEAMQEYAEIYAGKNVKEDVGEEKKCCKLNPTGCADCTEFERLNPKEWSKKLSPQEKPEKEEGWISVKERTPIFGKRVLTYTPDSSMTNEEQRLLIYGSIASGFPSGVTHWQLLPNPPKA